MKSAQRFERKELNVKMFFTSFFRMPLSSRNSLCQDSVLPAFGIRGERKKKTEVYVGRKLLFYNNQDRMRRR